MKIDKVELLYNMAAHFAAAEKYPDGLVKELQKPSIESYNALMWAFAECAKQAELWRRFMGEMPRKILTEEQWRLILKPPQLKEATAMVMKAIIDGLGEHDEEQEVDEVLQELEAQKKTK